jgi:hypothetical protein
MRLARLMSSERERRVMLVAARRWQAQAEAARKARSEEPDGT